MPLHVVHYLRDLWLELGGVTRTVLDLSLLLSQSGARVTLLTGDDRDAPPAWRSTPGHDPWHAGLPRVVSGIGDPVNRRRLRAEEAKRAADVLAAADLLHLHTPWAGENIDLARVARRLGKPYILTPHGMLDDWSMNQHGLKKRLYLALRGRRLLRGAAAIHTTAEAERQQAMRWVSGGRGVVIPCAFDLSPFRRLPGPDLAFDRWPVLRDEVPVLLYLGRLHAKKGPGVVIDVAAALHHWGIPVHAVIAGPGDDAFARGLPIQARDRGVGERVLFTGLVTGDLKLLLLERADLFVLPTQQENFGMALVEAMAAGTPVVTTRGVDTWRELEAGGALLAEPEPSALAAACRAALADPVALRERGEAGRRHVTQWLDERTIADAYLDLYHSAARSGR